LSGADEVLALVAKAPDTTLAELAHSLEKKHGVRAAVSMVWRLLDRHRLTFKKNRARQRAVAA
jgi:transposase